MMVSILFTIAFWQDEVPRLKQDTTPQVFYIATSADLAKTQKSVAECKTTDQVLKLAERSRWVVLRESGLTLWLETRPNGRVGRAIRMKRAAEVALQLPAKEPIPLSDVPGQLLGGMDIEGLAGPQRASGDPLAYLSSSSVVTLTLDGRSVNYNVPDPNLASVHAKLKARPLIDASLDPVATPGLGAKNSEGEEPFAICFNASPRKVPRELDEVALEFFRALDKATEKAEAERNESMQKLAEYSGVQGTLRKDEGKAVSRLTPAQQKALMIQMESSWQRMGFSSAAEAKSFALQAKVQKVSPKLTLMFGGSNGLLHGITF